MLYSSICKGKRYVPNLLADQEKPPRRACESTLPNVRVPRPTRLSLAPRREYHTLGSMQAVGTMCPMHVL